MFRVAFKHLLKNVKTKKTDLQSSKKSINYRPIIQKQGFSYKSLSTSRKGILSSFCILFPSAAFKFLKGIRNPLL